MLQEPLRKVEGLPPANLMLKRSEQKFYKNPGLTVTPGQSIATNILYGISSFTKVADLGEVICYFDTDERLRLRGILPPDPEVPAAVPEARRPAKRGKVSEYITMIDVTGDEPIISQIKKEQICC